MALRSAHGKGSGGLLRIETTPADELPAPVPGPATDTTGVARDQAGRISSPEAARALGALGGQQKAGGVRLARSLGLPFEAQSPAFAPYRRAAVQFRKHHCAELARQAGGEVGAGPSSMVASAAWQLAASRYLFDMASRSGEPATFKTASQLANDSRQNILAAYELAVREAEARAKAKPASAHSDLAAALEEPSR